MMPFVTEEIWARLPLAETDRAPMLLVAGWPDPARLAPFADPDAEASMAVVRDLVTAVRAVRARYGVKPRTAIRVEVRGAGAEAELLDNQRALVCALAGIGELVIGADIEKPAHAATAVGAGLDVVTRQVTVARLASVGVLHDGRVVEIGEGIYPLLIMTRLAVKPDLAAWATSIQALVREGSAPARALQVTPRAAETRPSRAAHARGDAGAAAGRRRATRHPRRAPVPAAGSGGRPIRCHSCR
jgi:hypothetical protein